MKAKPLYVQVAPCIPLPRGKHAYTYRASNGAPIKGTLVKIPFGKKVVRGIIVATQLQKPSYPTKEIIEVSSVTLTPFQMEFAQWISLVAHGGLGYTLRLFLPPSAKSGTYDNTKPKKRSTKKPETIAVVESVFDERKKLLMKAARKYIGKNGQVLILVPEVAMLDRYADVGTLYHAGLSISQKQAIWQGVHERSIQIVIGTQKALFLPFSNLVCVLVDEEQYESYKLWDQYPRLHTPRGAQQLSRIHAASLVYGSSCPSLFLSHLIQEKKCTVVVHDPVQVSVQMIAFSVEDRKWKRSVPNEAAATVRMWARSGKKVLVLYNKRDNAKISEALFWRLSKSAKKKILIGTTKVLTNMKEGDVDRILWLFPEFTMRAIDYRAEERTYALAARLQLVSPTQPVYMVSRYVDKVRFLFDTTQADWYTHVLKERSLLHLPPFVDLVRLTIRDSQAKKALKRAQEVQHILTASFGPYQELGSKQTQEAEYHILLKGNVEKLAQQYKDVPVDVVDVDPHRVV